jgi:hypothetical protein
MSRDGRSSAGKTWRIRGPKTWYVPDRQEALRARTAPARLNGFDPELPPEDLLSFFAVGPLWVLVELAEVEGRIEPIRIELRGRGRAKDSAAYPIRASDVRLIKFGELIDKSRRDLRAAAAWMAHDPDKDSQVPKVTAARPEDARRHLGASRAKSRRGRPPLAHEELKETARLYAQAVRAGSTSPNVDIAPDLNLSVSTVAKRVQKARAKGMLPQTRPGVAKG